jgi:hypothetical protein
MPTRTWFLSLVFLFGFGATSEAGVIDFETGTLLLSFGQTGRCKVSISPRAGNQSRF